MLQKSMGRPARHRPCWSRRVVVDNETRPEAELSGPPHVAYTILPDADDQAEFAPPSTRPSSGCAVPNATAEG